MMVCSGWRRSWPAIASNTPWKSFASCSSCSRCPRSFNTIWSDSFTTRFLTDPFLTVAAANQFSSEPSNSAGRWQESFPPSSHRDIPRCAVASARVRRLRTGALADAARSATSGVCVHACANSYRAPGRRLMQLVGMPRSQPECQDQKRDAEHQRIDAEPPGQHQRADQRSDDQQYAVDKRDGAAENEPPATILDVESESGRQHEGARNDGPGRD